MPTRKSSLYLLAPLLITLAACSDDTDFDFDASAEALDAANDAASAPQALFNPDPAAPVLPFPNNLFFAGSNDGTLNIPIAADADQSVSNPQVALNQMDGFSTISPITTTVSESLDPASLTIGDSIRVFEITAAGGIAVAALGQELDASQIVALSVGDQLVLQPLQPLKQKQDYLVVLTSGITDAGTEEVPAMPLQASALYSSLKGEEPFGNPNAQDEAQIATLANLEALRQAINSHVAQLASVPIAAEDIALSWVFRTQSIRDVLQATKDISSEQNLVLVDSDVDVPGVGGAPASIYEGTMSMPYYLTSVGTDRETDIPLALNSFWRNTDDTDLTDGIDLVPGAISAASAPEPNFTPRQMSVENIPVLMSLPEGASGAVPVTIFQHGITSNRTAMLAIASSMAAAGRAVIAIDIPLHGLVSDSEPGGAFLVPGDDPSMTRERTFNIDLQVNPDAENPESAGLPLPDGLVDPSGTYFINLQNLANTRDNLRQAIADLFVLRASLAGAVIGDGSVTFDTSDVSFVGHSLGGIVGTTMLSYFSATEFTSATLGMPGGGIAQLLANSGAFGPLINGGLAAAGIETGSAEFNQFLLAAQTLADSGDPINHAGFLASSGNATPLHMIQVLGDNVVPNAVATAPLSGTEPLARQLGLSQVADTSSSGGLVCFTQGTHSSLLLPVDATNPVIITEMQSEMAGFAATQGVNLPIDFSSMVILGPPIDGVPCSVAAAASAIQ